MQRLAHWTIGAAIAVGAIGALAGEVGGDASAQRAGRSVLLVLIDTLRADHVGAYGRDPSLTPNLDRLAGRSWLFENAYAPSSWTKPSVAALLTGRHPRSLGVEEREDALPSGVDTLANRLRSHGYATLGVNTNGISGAPYGFGRGFDRYVMAPQRPGPPGERPVRAAEDVTRTALELLDGIDPDRPVFLYTHYIDPHAPYLPHPGSRLGPEPAGRFSGARLQLRKMRKTPREELRDEDYARVRHLYAGEVEYVDRWVGRLLDGLAARQPEREWMVVVTADHGEGLWDHGQRAHGKQLYEELLRVPLLIHHPGMEEDDAQRVDAMASLLDVTPTILAAVGASGPEGADGNDLNLLDEREKARPLLYHSLDADGYSLDAIRTRTHKLIRVRERRYLLQPPWQLYDLAADPNERSDRVWHAPLRTLEMRLALGRIAGAFTARSGAAERVELDELDPETLESLRALGYVDDDTTGAR